MELDSTVQWRELFIIKAKPCFCRNTKWERRGKWSVRCWRSSGYTWPTYKLIVYVFTGRDAKMLCWWRLHVNVDKTAFLSLKFTHTQPARAWRLGYKLCLRSGAWSWLQSCSIFPCPYSFFLQIWAQDHLSSCHCGSVPTLRNFMVRWTPNFELLN